MPYGRHPLGALRCHDPLRPAVLCRATGWRVRVYTNYGPLGAAAEPVIRSSWSPDKRTVIILFDPSSPNLMNFLYIG